MSQNKRADDGLRADDGQREDDGTRTRDPNLGKVVLYQLSHVRDSFILAHRFTRKNYSEMTVEM